MENPLVTISTMKKPVIAQLQGVTTANGMGLAAVLEKRNPDWRSQ